MQIVNKRRNLRIMFEVMQVDGLIRKQEVSSSHPTLCVVTFKVHSSGSPLCFSPDLAPLLKLSCYGTSWTWMRRDRSVLSAHPSSQSGLTCWAGLSQHLKTADILKFSLVRV
jgi:hypothetical protein